MSDIRIVSTKKLQAMMAAANVHVDEELDKDGTHALQGLTSHFEGFVRMTLCDVVLKVKGDDKPHRGKILLLAEDVDKLPTASVGF